MKDFTIMRILAIDYGTKNIGLAVSDESLTIARELGVFSPKNFWDGVEKIITEHGIHRILVGVPFGLSGVDSKSSLLAKSFIKKLQNKTSVPVEAVDERFTTDLARRISGTGSHHDSLVAQIILQEYLDRSVSGSES